MKDSFLIYVNIISVLLLILSSIFAFDKKKRFIPNIYGLSHSLFLALVDKLATACCSEGNITTFFTRHYNFAACSGSKLNQPWHDFHLFLFQSA